MKPLLVSVTLDGQRYTGLIYVPANAPNKVSHDDLCNICPPLRHAPRGKTYSIG